VRFIYRPGLREESRWWPSKPKVTGGLIPWEPGEKELKWLATGKGVRKKSTETYILCVGGPYHNNRVQYRLDKKTGRVRETVCVLPDVITCPPYSGRYRLKRQEEPADWRYEWRA
jgi:hypothetical protein